MSYVDIPVSVIWVRPCAGRLVLCGPRKIAAIGLISARLAGQQARYRIIRPAMAMA
jgi:hypothetical protein